MQRCQCLIHNGTLKTFIEINDVEDIVIFLGLKVSNSIMFACSKNLQFNSVENSKYKIISFIIYK